MLKFIAEDKIDAVLERVNENSSFYSLILEDIVKSYPQITSFLNRNNFKLLKEEEYECMWFLYAIIHQSCIEEMDFEADRLEISSESIEKREEYNWGILNDSPKGEFYKRITSFYKNYLQEDLLAFVEDSLNSEDNDYLSNVGTEIIFVSLKTLIDVLTKSY